MAENYIWSAFGINVKDICNTKQYGEIAKMNDLTRRPDEFWRQPVGPEKVISMVMACAQ